MVDEGHCPYSHVDELIPFGAYPRPARTLAAVGEVDEHALYHATEVIAALPMPGGDTTENVDTPDDSSR